MTAEKRHHSHDQHRLDRRSGASLRNWQQPAGPAAKQMTADAAIDMGWGRLLFAHTFESNEKLVETLCADGEGRRDIALYLRDPHVVLSMAPDRLFLDPSHTYRLWTHRYQARAFPPQGLIIRRIRTREDAQQVNRIYAERHMVTADPDFMLDKTASRLRTYFIAETEHDHQIHGTVTGIDHVEAFKDPENGASLWCLAVDPQATTPGIGQALVRQLIEHYFARGRQYVDLSVMHDNTQAIALYEKLGFERVPAFCVKYKNPINEPLFTPPQPDAKLNPYAKIIVDEARRRGIKVEVLDAEMGYFKLSLGGRCITCRESLTELTHAVAMSRCQDKRITQRVMKKAGVAVPDQKLATDADGDEAFLKAHGSLVVKPVNGEQGNGVVVDVRSAQRLREAVTHAKRFSDEVLLEQYVPGQDLRVVVINFEVVAAAVRKPPVIVGTGKHTIDQLIEKYNRRRIAATAGESRIPLDGETHRAVAQAGHSLDTVLTAEEALPIRKTANLHTGGTIHDVTDRLHDTLKRAAVQAAQALDIPVVGLDLIVPNIEGDQYVMIEANERVGLANHEPQPTAQRFIDFLFPNSITHQT